MKLLKGNQGILSIPWIYAAATLILGGGVSGQSTVSVYLPEYGENDWAALRGSIISKNSLVTAYTVFCGEQSPGCQIAGDLPFVFTQGPATLIYSGAAPGTLTADLECKLAEKTAATCTGSSSLGPNHWQGTLTGPTQTVWTKTFTGPQVTWAALTLTTPGPFPQTTDIDGTAAASLSSSGRPRTLRGGTDWTILATMMIPSIFVMFFFCW
ncbi:hypothetical protein QBC38DRAFT_479676 [Podospora fimiseda]|uniref:Uncharacterized protein n=1 Tax=Podospora fimiseda TaxID=252190 RepID=A0AAN7BNZ1_9PEZI|nr:hypothetical protein QBC38DRAFT_479676 [Podospora fimiseda]